MTYSNHKLTKKLSIMLSMILMVSLFVNPILAEETTSVEEAARVEEADENYEYFSYAEKLSVIGVFVGTGDGYELYREPTRIEGLIILIRLLGKEQEALKGEYPLHPFEDVPEWASNYVNYAYAEGLTVGKADGTFGTADLMQPKSFATFCLRALGYDDGAEDFNWDEALEFAQTVELLDEELYTQMKEENFNRNLVAKASYNALVTNMKTDGEYMTLSDFLVREKIIDEEVALKMELISGPVLVADDEEVIGLSTTSLVDENGETPLLGPATASQDVLAAWAKSKGMSQDGLDLIPIYYEICEGKGLNPVIQYVQMCLETGYLYKVKSGAGIDETYHNPCGLKTTTGGEGYTASTFAKFDSWYDGIDAHTDHTALYAGVEGYPKADSKDPRHFPYLLGRVTTVEGLSGTWAESDYHYKLFKLYNEILLLAGHDISE